jgi:mono/diheme cytochrome c family protein
MGLWILIAEEQRSMITKAIGLTILAAATLIAVPATAQGQVNPALIGEGAVLWANNCGRCHNVRSPTERTDTEWVTILMHMRARANLTRHQADAVLAYLQATNTAEAPAGSASAASNVERQRARGSSD